MSLAASSLSTLRRQLVDGEVSPRDIMEDVIARITSRDEEIGAFLSFDAEAALLAKALAEVKTGGPPAAA